MFYTIIVDYKVTRDGKTEDYSSTHTVDTGSWQKGENFSQGMQIEVDQAKMNVKFSEVHGTVKYPVEIVSVNVVPQL